MMASAFYGSSRIKTADKDPDAVKNYTRNWAPFLVDDTLDEVEWIIQTFEGDAAPLIEIGSSSTDTTSTVLLGGGELGRTYLVTCRATTVAGLVEDASFKIKIVSQ